MRVHEGALAACERMDGEQHTTARVQAGSPVHPTYVEHLRVRWLISSAPLPPPDSAPSAENATPAAFIAAATCGGGGRRGGNSSGLRGIA